MAAVPALCAPAAAPKKAAPKKTTTARKAAAARLSAATRADAQRRVADYLDARPAAPIERPGALVPFFELLSRLSRGLRDSVHILHFGDSHTASDDWTGPLRVSLQQQFGDGGAGFGFPGYPFLGYRRFDLHGGASKRWKSEGLLNGNGDSVYGLGGLSITTNDSGQSVYLVADCAYVEVFYQQQPGGGRIALYEDGERAGEVSTEGELGPAYLAHHTEPGPHRFEIHTLDDAPVRLFGWVAEKPQGVTYEPMGINGSTAPMMLRWNEATQASFIGRRDPALIVLAYGTNDASAPQWTLETYRDAFSEVLQRLRRAAPAASILVIGPPDRMQRISGRWRPLEKLDMIVAAQREACQINRCAFWDTRARMGGKGSMQYWVYAGLAQGDYAHFTSAGYQRLAETLYTDLRRDYGAFLNLSASEEASPNSQENGNTKQDH